MVYRPTLHEMIAEALDRPALWNRWEGEFLRSVRHFRQLSDKQIAVIERLYRRAVRQRRRRSTKAE